MADPDPNALPPRIPQFGETSPFYTEGPYPHPPPQPPAVVAPPQPTVPGAPAQTGPHPEANALAQDIGYANQGPNILLDADGIPVTEQDVVAREREARGIFEDFDSGDRVLGEYGAAPPRATGPRPDATVTVERPGDVAPEVAATRDAQMFRAAELALDEGFLRGRHGREMSEAIDAVIPTIEGITELFVDEVAEHRRAVRGEMESLQGAIRALERAQVDPNRFYSSNSGMTGVAAAINIGVGAMASVLAPGTPNFAMQIITDAIDKDIRAQEANIDNQARAVGARFQFLQHQEEVWGNREDAILATRALYLEDAARRVQSLASRQQGELAMMQGAQLAVELQTRALNAQIQLAQSRISTRVNHTTRLPAAERFAERQRGVVAAIDQVGREMTGQFLGGQPQATQDSPGQPTAPQEQAPGMAVEAPNSPAEAPGAPRAGVSTPAPTAGATEPPRGRRRARVPGPSSTPQVTQGSPPNQAARPSGEETTAQAAAGLRSILGPDVVGSVVVDRDPSDGQATFIVRPPPGGRVQRFSPEQRATLRQALPGYAFGRVGDTYVLRPIAATPTRRGLEGAPHENFAQDRRDQGTALVAIPLDPVHPHLGTIRPTSAYLDLTDDARVRIDERINAAGALLGAIEDLSQQIDDPAFSNRFGAAAGVHEIQANILASMRSVSTGQGGMTEDDYRRAMSGLPDPGSFTQSDDYARGAAQAMRNFVMRKYNRELNYYFVREGIGASRVTSGRPRPRETANDDQATARPSDVGNLPPPTETPTQLTPSPTQSSGPAGSSAPSGGPI